ncbi:MAG TPA: nucleotide exchange factor GrpE [Rhizomicrobium sp.]|jgi:molecular chaperone GrpE|nr:nucleotide exchange factor GrpE [Rhizomicrobium sp.]
MSEDPDTQTPQDEAPHAAEFAVLEALKAEVESLKDQRLRALAEVENIRRRAERERTEASQYAITKFARDMLAIADNFARALAAVPRPIRDAADPQLKAVLDGVEATDRQLMATLERYGVKPIDAGDGKFDPNLHQAIAEVPGNGKPPGSIVDVVQAGFMIGERLLRPAMVTVARKDSAPVAGFDTSA